MIKFDTVLFVEILFIELMRLDNQFENYFMHVCYGKLFSTLHATSDLLRMAFVGN